MIINLIFKQKYSIVTFLLTIIAAAVDVFVSYSFSLIIQATVDKNLRFMVMTSALVIFLYILLNTLGVLRGVYIEKLVQNYSIKLRKIATTDFKNKLIFNEKENNGAECIALNTTDIQQFEQYAINVISAVYNISLVIISTYAIIKINSVLFLISLGLSLLMLFLPRVFEKTIKSTTKDISKTTEEYTKDLEVALSGAEMLHNYNALTILDKIVKRGSENIRDAKVNRRRAIMTLQGYNVTLNAINQILLIFAGAYFAYKGYIEFSMIFAVSGVTGNFFGGLTGVIDLYPNFASVREILEKYPKVEKERHEDTITSLEKGIELKDLSYEYKNSRVSFPNLNFVKNKKYIIRGESGRGKSTLLNILNGNLKNYEGHVSWDGKEVRNFNVKAAISTIEQKVQLLNMSIKDNIILTKEYDEELFKRVIEYCKLKDAINNLEDKENTILDNKNLSLSGGQLQRISLARSLYNKKEIFVIDEGTSNLDSKLADELEEIILKDSDVTVIMVTHRNSEKINSLVDEVITL